MKTEFAPAERASEEDIKLSRRKIKNLDRIIELLNSLPIYVLILNNQRQIIYANSVFSDSLGLNTDENLIGKRPGEAVNCIHAFETEGGCGTTEFCKTCGAVKAILQAQKSQKGDQECRITQGNNEVLDILVWANPIIIEDEMFTIFAVSDISNEKRRNALERIFFHDILNTAGGLKGYVELLQDTNNPVERDEFLDNLNSLTEKLIEEIQAQRQLIAAERNQLKVNVKVFPAIEILEEVKQIYEKHHVAEGKIIGIDKESYNSIIETDKAILRRVIGNFAKNALEAVSKDEKVKISCSKINDDIQFEVHNPSFIERQIQLQIFQRSFSTKSSDRGLGTYSAKLLTEKYLNGKVGFTTSETEGTTFFARLPLKL